MTSQEIARTDRQPFFVRFSKLHEGMRTEVRFRSPIRADLLDPAVE